VVIIEIQKIKPSLKKYFDIQETGEKEISYPLDYDKIDALRKNLGYFSLLSTDSSLSAEEALTILGLVYSKSTLKNFFRRDYLQLLP
jgi:hypothetical protein